MKQQKSRTIKQQNNRKVGQQRNKTIEQGQKETEDDNILDRKRSPWSIVRKNEDRKRVTQDGQE